MNVGTFRDKLSRKNENGFKTPAYFVEVAEVFSCHVTVGGFYCRKLSVTVGRRLFVLETLVSILLERSLQESKFLVKKKEGTCCTYVMRGREA